MAEYNAAQAAPLWNDDLPNPLPERAVIALVGNECPHCHTLMAETGYRQQMPDGRPIIYIDMWSERGADYFNALGMQVARDERGNNLLIANGQNLGAVALPSLLGVENGRVASVLAVNTDAAMGVIFMEQARIDAQNALANPTQGNGSTVPHLTTPTPAGKLR
jgi:hypothetical protein